MMDETKFKVLFATHVVVIGLVLIGFFPTALRCLFKKNFMEALKYALFGIYVLFLFSYSFWEFLNDGNEFSRAFMERVRDFFGH